MRYPAAIKKLARNSPVRPEVAKGEGGNKLVRTSIPQHERTMTVAIGFEIVSKRCRVLLAGLTWFCCCLVLGLQSPALARQQPAVAEKIQESVIAGSWYPGTEAALRREVEGFLAQVPPMDLGGQLVALISPHAGYRFSGKVAAYAYKLLQQQKFSTVVIIAPSHHARFPGVSVYDQGGFRTPLGVVELDRELIAALKERDSRIRYFPEAYTKEHSLEIQLPFLQVVMPGFKLVPLVMGEQNLAACEGLAEAVAGAIRGKSVLVVASSDLSHFHSSQQAKALDQVVLDRVNGFDARGLHQSLAEGRCEACGGGAMVSAMLAARALGANGSRVLYTANSGDVTGDHGNVVGYMAAALWKSYAENSPNSPLPKGDQDDSPGARVSTGQVDSAGKRSAATDASPTGVDLGLTAGEKALLRQIARETIEARCRGERAPGRQMDSGTLKEQRGAFVTLKKHGELRGCIGHIVGSRPLGETVREMAEAAAFQDPRFPPVNSSELKDLELEISVLTPLRRISEPGEIQVGTHGIYMRRGSASGLLLPQVATEYGWDRTMFLEQTCIKARLPRDAWKDGATEIYIFSADIF
jgi:MEMO1 family protein